MRKLIHSIILITLIITMFTISGCGKIKDIVEQGKISLQKSWMKTSTDIATSMYESSMKKLKETNGATFDPAREVSVPYNIIDTTKSVTLKESEIELCMQSIGVDREAAKKILTQIYQTTEHPDKIESIELNSYNGFYRALHLYTYDSLHKSPSFNEIQINWHDVNIYYDSPYKHKSLSNIETGVEPLQRLLVNGTYQWDCGYDNILYTEYENRLANVKQHCCFYKLDKYNYEYTGVILKEPEATLAEQVVYSGGGYITDIKLDEENQKMMIETSSGMTYEAYYKWELQTYYNYKGNQKVGEHTREVCIIYEIKNITKDKIIYQKE